MADMRSKSGGMFKYVDPWKGLVMPDPLPTQMHAIASNGLVGLGIRCIGIPITSGRRAAITQLINFLGQAGGNVMTGFYERRKSRAAVWCLRLAVIAVPFFILTIFLHRSASVTTEQAFWLIAFGIALLLGSLVFGLRAAIDLWEKGYKGGRATVNGIVLAVLLLIPFGIQLVKALENPQLNDVATDVVNPPLFLVDVKGDGSEKPESIVYDEYTSRQIVANYPELVARRYNAPPERVVVSVLEILDQWNWQITASRNLPKTETEPADEDNNDELAGTEEELNELQQAGEDSGEDINSGPGGAATDIVIQVKARSFVMKLPSFLVIRLVSSGDTTLVDMRSASLWGRHDFGSNMENITGFLEQLDETLAGLAGEG